MKYSGSLKTQRISRSTKRLTTHAKRYATNEGGILTMREQWLREGGERLLKGSKSRFSDYDNLAFLHNSMGDIQQIAFGNTQVCKTHLYQSALYKSYACRYFDKQNPIDQASSEFAVNLRALTYFEAAVIADADEVACLLGNQLLFADQGPMPITVEKIEGALIHLFNGDDCHVKENCDFIKANQETLWTCKSMFESIELYEAILAEDNQKVYDLFVASLRKNRRDPNLEFFLDFLHIAIGKIAIKRGLELPMDTEDCPQCLLQPEVCDYNSLTIQTPIEGFPWETI